MSKPHRSNAALRNEQLLAEADDLNRVMVEHGWAVAARTVAAVAARVREQQADIARLNDQLHQLRAPTRRAR